MFLNICKNNRLIHLEHIFNVNIRRLHSAKCSVIDKELWLKPAGYNTGIKVFNHILKEKADLILKNQNIATWYSCGPTVYDSTHIGHANCYVKFDIIRRIMEEWFDINVVMVMGITDIDDKIINKANHLNTNFKIVAEKYEKEFFSDIESLNILKPTLYARVSDYIPVIINFIQKIICNGHAYVMPTGSVYFNVKSFQRYNKFGVAAMDEFSDNEHNIELNRQSAFDFVLWKRAKAGEPFWDSPWGPGRPGWHIECSAIASEIFGTNIDLHSGGIDLKFPHHENEEAQSCSHHCVDQWVNYWMYSGHLHYKGGEKMSKSLKNTLSVEKFLEKHSANEFRIFCLMTPYGKRVEYDDDTIRAACGIYKKVESFLQTCDFYLKGQLNGGCVHEQVLFKDLAETETEVRLSLSDNFDTSTALTSILNLITTTNSMIHDKSENIVRSPVSIAVVSNFIKQTFCKFGLNFDISRTNSHMENPQMLEDVINSAVDLRCKLRKIIREKVKTESNTNQMTNSIFTSCDEFRSKLNSLGIELQDYEEKCCWKFKGKPGK